MQRLFDVCHGVVQTLVPGDLCDDATPACATKKGALRIYNYGEKHLIGRI